ncbi:MAG: pentapeptide repeat-containing protein, partial [Ktedonobacterales bacterium]|nr:pentapeptide repeat-containing protein [Ktedonobacterales bacterium]
MSADTRPTNNSDGDGWKAHWVTLKQPWRTEPEISTLRQSELERRRRDIEPHIEKGRYPFREVRLSRADVEWLLATHEDGRGPVTLADLAQKDHIGIDLRGAKLEKVDLSGLPLTRMLGGLTHEERRKSTHLQRHMAAINLEEANLDRCPLQQAALGRARLQHANFEYAELQEADLGGARLQGTSLRGAKLGKAYLRRAFFDAATNFDEVEMRDSHFGCAIIVDAVWHGVNLHSINWGAIKKLGDEDRTKQMRNPDGSRKTRQKRIQNMQDALRANLQLSTALRVQGMSEYADHFAYRAQVCQRRLFRLRGLSTFGNYLGAGFLDLLAGYGYRPGRSILAYVVLISMFTVLYHLSGMGGTELSW